MVELEAFSESNPQVFADRGKPRQVPAEREK
jgi:hypothetical protein